MRYLVVLIFFLCLFSVVAPSRAGIYRYVDENGVIHFTNCPRDERYKLYIRESTDDVGEESRGNQENPPPVFLQNAKNYDSIINEFSKKYQVDFALIKAIIRAESGFNPLAVSKKGAKGLMQLMPATAQRMSVSNVFNPRENIDGGVRYFKYLLSLFNDDLRLSLAAYNAGENLVSQIRTIPPYRETVDYVRRVLSFYQSYRP
jgi:soluble lytic murein transglycosylase-like protein